MKSSSNIPIHGARKPALITESTLAVEFGALPKSAMVEIEELIERRPEGELEDLKLNGCFIRLQLLMKGHTS